MQHEHEQEKTIARRGLLRRAGTVAVGVAGAGVAGAMISSPAQASDGQPLIVGQANSGTESTGLTAGNAGKPTLVLDNPTTTGPALALNPTQSVDLPVNPTSPTGSVYTDGWGELFVVGEGEGSEVGPKFLNPIYSATWAAMPLPVDPIRWVDTRTGTSGGRSFIVPGSATFDSAGRVMPRNSATAPDMVIDFSPILLGGYAAVQANLTVDMATGGGWVALWGAGDFPHNSSINFSANTPIANFTQTLLGDDMRLRVKVLRPVAIIFDIQGFVLADPFAQIASGTAEVAALKSASPEAHASLQRIQQRRPLARS